MTATPSNPALRWSPSFLAQQPPSLLPLERFRHYNLSRSLESTLDRVNVLGDDDDYGHTGCVNALSWARDGEILLSGGDDTTVRIWRMDPTNMDQKYPFVCRSVINTGHRANIFNAHMMPYSSRIVTAAGDKQVRIFDIGTALTAAPDGVETQYTAHQAGVQVLRCHKDRVKRIVTEDSPDLFLTVGEDGTVRQHDLRTPHNCRNGSCPAPLMKVGHELSTLSLSPLTPYQFVVAGESPYGYLFDRRHFGRRLEVQWGTVPRAGEELTTCVRRFGRLPKPDDDRRGRGRTDHITGSRVSTSNGHEVLLTYSSDGVYLYSTYDEPQSNDSLASPSSSPILPSNAKWRKLDGADTAPKNVGQFNFTEEPASDPTLSHHGEEDSEEEEDDEDAEAFIEFDDFSSADESKCEPGVPVIMPRKRYVGARNVATVKDVNFLGPDDEWVASGSDDGNFFLWDKASGALHGIYEGDSSVVNVIEAHPHLPLVAVSGIDTTVKLFAPTHRSSSDFSRMDNAQHIIDTNVRLSRTRVVRYNFAELLAEARAAMGAEEADIPECTNQ